MSLRTAALVPAYQAAERLGEVLEGLLRHLAPRDVIVVDDGSTDGTSVVAREAGVSLLAHIVNRGKGAALRTGFDHAVEGGYEAVVTLDADGQHDPASLPDFLEAAERTGAGIVLGTRMRRVADMPFHRKAANRITSRMISRLAGQPVEDSQSGYRLIRTDVLRAIHLESRHFDLESEILIRAARAGFRIEHVPIETIYRDEGSHIRPVTDTVRFLCLLWRSRRWKERSSR